MFTLRVGKTKMDRKSRKGLWLCLLLLLPVALLITIILQEYRKPVKSLSAADRLNDVSSSAPSCPKPKTCPDKHFSFYMQSGAANIVAPKICFQGQLVLGTVTKNAGVGINIVVMHGITGELMRTGNFDMYSGDVKDLIAFLKSIEIGTILLMASYDDPASKLNDEAKKVMSHLGSTKIQSLGFRDNWLFVGWRGATKSGNVEKLMKSDAALNKYEHWPELIDLEGCIPQL